MKHLANTPEMQRLIPMMLQGGKVPPRRRRFIYGYALDHSEFPCYLLWPCRDQEEYWLVDTMTDGYLLLSTETYFRPLGLHHFYDAFSLDGRANLRKDAIAQFQLAEEEPTSDLRLTPAAVLRCRGTRRSGGEASESCTDSEESSDEQDGSPHGNARTPLTEDIHQHGLMVAAYRDVGNEYTVDKGLLRKGLKALQDFESVPRRWPLARLTVPLLKSVEHLDRVLAGCCWEVLITRKNPDDSLGALRQAARSLTSMLASYLAEFVAETLRAARTSQGAPLTDEENIFMVFAVVVFELSPLQNPRREDRLARSEGSTAGELEWWQRAAPAGASQDLVGRSAQLASFGHWTGLDRINTASHRGVQAARIIRGEQRYFFGERVSAFCEGAGLHTLLMASDDVMRSVDDPEGVSRLFFTYDDVCTHAVLAKSVSTGLLVCIPSKALEEEVFTSAEAAEYNGLIGPYSFTSVPALAAQGRKSKRFLEVVLFDLDISGQDLLCLEVPLGVDAASVVTFGDYRGVVDWPHPGGIAEVATQLVASGGD
eukprot:symbB.v1.2.040574.t1/scaffold7346.1/size11807/1